MSNHKGRAVKSRQGLWRWLDERLGLDGLHYEAPRHANSIFYTLGGITLGGMVILFITGFYLAQFYNPTPAEARDSVLYIMTKVSLGEFIRSVHWWTANLVVITAILHMARVYITASYKRPRELNWVAGVIMLLLVVALFFTGTTLKWDQEGYEALGHVEEVGGLVGWLGKFFTSDFTQSVPLLTRVSFFHVAILPGILVLFTILHLLLVKHHGISPLPIRRELSDPMAYDAQEKTEPITYFDRHLLRLVGYSLALTAAASVLAIAVPATLGEAVIPGREVTKPPLLFWWLTTLENWWTVRALLWVAIIVPIALLIIPFIDRTPFRHILNRRWLLVLGILVTLTLIAFTILGGLAPIGHHIE